MSEHKKGHSLQKAPCCALSYHLNRRQNSVTDLFPFPWSTEILFPDMRTHLISVNKHAINDLTLLIGERWFIFIDKPNLHGKKKLILTVILVQRQNSIEHGNCIGVRRAGQGRGMTFL